MKTQTLLVLLITIFAFSFTAQASFPVKRATTSITTVEKTVENNEVKAITPAAFAGGKSQGVALVLALVLGLLAAHRWYLGTIWFYNIFFILTLGGFGVWLLIDIIRIITKDLGPKDGRYNKNFF